MHRTSPVGALQLVEQIESTSLLRPTKRCTRSRRYVAIEPRHATDSDLSGVDHLADDDRHETILDDQLLEELAVNAEKGDR